MPRRLNDNLPEDRKWRLWRRVGHAAKSINLSIHFSDLMFLTSSHLVSEANRTCCRARLTHWTVRRGVRPSQARRCCS